VVAQGSACMQCYVLQDAIMADPCSFIKLPAGSRGGKLRLKGLRCYTTYIHAAASERIHSTVSILCVLPGEYEMIAG
jgi:hypothetical protein